MPPQTPHLVAGKEAMSAMAKLLGLTLARDAWRLEALCGLGEENVRLGLRHGETRLVLYLLPPEAPEALLKTGGLSLSVAGEAGPALRRFLAVAAAKLGRRSLKDILRLITQDPESFAEMEAGGYAGVSMRVPISAGPISFLGAGWRNFFSDQDFEVLLGYPDLSMRKTIYARYSDRECLYSWAGNDPRKWSFLAYPVRVPSDSFGAAVFRQGIVMELEERDMVLGPNEKADALVASVARRAAGSDAEFVVFNHFCTTIVMGEDLGEVARRIEQASGRTTVRWSHGDRDRLDNFGGYFRTLFSRPDFFDEPADKDTVNLFHFPTDFRDGELAAWLGAMGLRINLRLFPDIDFPSIAALPRGRLQVFCEATSYQARLQELLAKAPRPVVTTPAPYGITGTRKCLAAIAAGAGKRKAFEKAWAQRISVQGPVWDALRREAQGYRLAFVVDQTTLSRLWGLRHGQGAPLMPMIEEMGFGVDILYYDPHAETPQLPKGSPDATLTTFRTPRELELLLREGSFRAVYSDIFFDWRLSASGKARFSSQHFEMGLDGAVRSLRRLLGLCRMPFYARYAAHLSGREGRTL